MIDFQEIRTGERNDATVYATYSWARKLGQAVAGGLTGWALTWIGYVSTAGEHIIQTDQVLDWIYSIATLLPALLLLVSLLALIFWYPLSKKRVDENVATLAAKHESQSSHS